MAKISDIAKTLEEAGVDGSYRMPLLAIAKLLTDGDPNYRLDFVGGAGNDVAGMFQVHEGTHGKVGATAQEQCLQAVMIWTRLIETLDLDRYGIPSEQNRLAAYLAVCVLAWRRPAVVREALEHEPDPPVHWANLIELIGLEEGRRYYRVLKGLVRDNPKSFVVGQERALEKKTEVPAGLPDWALWTMLALSAVGVSLLAYKVLKK